MPPLTAVIAALALVGSAHAAAQARRSDAELRELVSSCNEIASAERPARRSVRACDTLTADGQMALVDRSAIVAYQRYQEEQRQACERRKASPRGASRSQAC